MFFFDKYYLKIELSFYDISASLKKFMRFLYVLRHIQIIYVVDDLSCFTRYKIT